MFTIGQCLGSGRRCRGRSAAGATAGTDCNDEVARFGHHPAIHLEPSRYVLSFDGQRGGGGFAYDDAIFEVSATPQASSTPHGSLIPLPEPSSLFIGGVSLLGLIGFHISRRM